MENESTKSHLETLEKLSNIAEKKPAVAVAIAFAGIISVISCVYLLHLNLTTFTGAAVLAAFFVIAYIFIYGILHVLKSLLDGIVWVLKTLFQWSVSPITTQRNLQKELADRRNREAREKEEIFSVIREGLSQRSKLMLFVWLKQGSQSIQLSMNDREALPFVQAGLMDQVACPIPCHTEFRFKTNVWNALQSVKAELLSNPGINEDIEHYETQIAPMKNIFPWM